MKSTLIRKDFDLNNYTTLNFIPRLSLLLKKIYPFQVRSIKRLNNNHNPLNFSINRKHSYLQLYYNILYCIILYYIKLNIKYYIILYVILYYILYYYTLYFTIIIIIYYIHIKLSEIIYHQNKRIKNRKKPILSLKKI